MPTPPEPGGTKYTREGIEPANAYWVEIEAYRDALIDLTKEIADPELRTRFLMILNKQGVSNNYLKDALHVMEVIGLSAKQERLVNGETPRSTKKR
jgi:hypothetical protein